MKITKRQLQRIIKEELKNTLYRESLSQLPWHDRSSPDYREPVQRDEKAEGAALIDSRTKALVDGVKKAAEEIKAGKRDISNMSKNYGHTTDLDKAVWATWFDNEGVAKANLKRWLLGKDWARDFDEGDRKLYKKLQTGKGWTYHNTDDALSLIKKIVAPHLEDEIKKLEKSEPPPEKAKYPGITDDFMDNFEEGIANGRFTRKELQEYIQQEVMKVFESHKAS